jgi:hypothetical protein
MNGAERCQKGDSSEGCTAQLRGRCQICTGSVSVCPSWMPLRPVTVPAAVDMESPGLWDNMPCRPLRTSRRFGGTCRLYLQSRTISHETNMRQLGNRSPHERFQIFTAMTVKNAVFRDMKTQFVRHRTHNVSATEPSRLMLCKILGFHGGDYEECRLLGYKNPVRTSQDT